MFVFNFFLRQTFINQKYEAIPKQNDHFQTHCAWKRAFEERENKQKNAKFKLKFIRVIFLFPPKYISDAILWEKKDNAKLCNVYKNKWLVTMFTNKDFYE